MIAIDLSKQQVLDADPRQINSTVQIKSNAIQQINFTANLDREGDTTMFFIIKEAKETVFEFSKGIVKVLQVGHSISNHHMVPWVTPPIFLKLKSYDAFMKKILS